ncbi:hypothetical protein J6590_002893 [Homalodisca vitripennis]|nr:hypothetical protein J6590_002893 [Homalodisca vitripennis]
MRKAFQVCDVNKSGFIETLKISGILTTIGQVFDEAELQEVIEEKKPALYQTLQSKRAGVTRSYVWASNSLLHVVSPTNWIYPCSNISIFLWSRLSIPEGRKLFLVGDLRLSHPINKQTVTIWVSVNLSSPLSLRKNLVVLALYQYSRPSPLSEADNIANPRGGVAIILNKMKGLS